MSLPQAFGNDEKTYLVLYTEAPVTACHPQGALGSATHADNRFTSKHIHVMPLRDGRYISAIALLHAVLVLFIKKTVLFIKKTVLVERYLVLCIKKIVLVERYLVLCIKKIVLVERYLVLCIKKIVLVKRYLVLCIKKTVLVRQLPRCNVPISVPGAISYH